MNDDTFKCEMCGGIFQKGQSDEEALKETKQIFGELRMEELAIICEDCYKKIDPENNPHLVEEAMRETLEERKSQGLF